jgi:hypothetical protein
MAISRADKARKEERIAACVEFIGLGVDRKTCGDMLRQRFNCDIKSRQVDRYRKEAMELLINESQIKNQDDIDKAIGKMTAKLKWLYKQALADRNLKLAFDIVQSEGKLSGVYNTKLEIENKESGLEEISNEELLKLVNKDSEVS